MNQAKDAAELVEVDYDTLPVVTSTAAATDPNSPRIWQDFPNNISNIHDVGNKDAVDAAFAEAAHVVKQHFVINRIITNSMETRGCVGTYDPVEQRYTLYGDTQNPHSSRRQLAEEVFKINQHDVRLIIRDIGGAFGLKDTHFPEVRLCLMAAEELNRPVKWVCERSESFLADDHARDQITDAELALDENGKFLAFRVKYTCNMGAYLSGSSNMVPAFVNLGAFAGVYTTPVIHVEVPCVFSNTQSTGPYRGAGRPEAIYTLERLIDIAALKLDIDRIELRRRNIIAASAMPFQTGLIYKYDSGEFEQNMDQALKLVDFDNFDARRIEALENGKLLGLGVINMIEESGGSFPEHAEIRFDGSGSATVMVGTKAQGHGHETMYKILLSDMLGMDTEDIRVVEGDTDKVSFGSGTIGSRSAMSGGAALRGAADKIITKGVRIAAHLLEAAEDDIEFTGSDFRVSGTDKALSMKEVAIAAFQAPRLPHEIEPGLYEQSTFRPTVVSFPNGCHICEVEVDEDTGRVRMLNYVAVDDVGTVVNQLTLDGQIHGGIAQGAGQALMENIHHDPETG
ncbi:MAG: molybdopterin-dependent oxidoreductase, partial [Rhodospirillales bacterium]|nr:molybdopterin-dependent oxidoreductase [Rhodospirillales bacterium]